MKTKHVSFDSFKETVGEIWSDLNKYIITHNPNKIVLYIHPEMHKSNFWLSLYFYNFINKNYPEKIVVITYLMKDISDLGISENDIVIIPDDASYTGSQLSNYLGNITVRSNYFLAVPYISEEAYQRILSVFRTNINILMSEQTKKFSKFSSDDVILNDPRYTIYFDHKLPDIISIYQLTYALGVDSNKGGRDDVTGDPYFNFEPLSLIKNCHVPNVTIPVKYISDLQDIIGSKNMCPPPFYKFYNYKYKGKTITDLENI